MNQGIYVCFLRGINVSGKNIVSMKDLADLFMKSGFSDITTYLQSGNVIFKSPDLEITEQIRNKIEKSIADHLKLKVPVLVRTGKSVFELSGKNAFLNTGNFDHDKLHVTMLDKVPDIERINSLRLSDFSPEKFIFTGNDIFLYCPDGYGRAKLNHNFLERKLGTFATTRNWRTITKIQEIIERKESV